MAPKANAPPVAESKAVPPPAPTPPSLEEALARLAVSHADTNRLLNALVQTSQSSDFNVATSKAESKNLLPVELQAFRDIDPTATDANPFGTDDTKRTELVEVHRRRGRKIEAVKKLLPQDGYLNQSHNLDAWKTHPITSSNLTEADVRKSEPELSRFLHTRRWDVRFTARSNLRTFRTKVQTTMYDEVVRAADYQSYLTGSNIRYFVLEHLIFSCWKRASTESEYDASGVPHQHSIPYRPPDSLADPSSEVQRRVPADIYSAYNNAKEEYLRWDPTIPNPPSTAKLVPELFQTRVQDTFANEIVRRHKHDPDVQAHVDGVRPLTLVLEPLPKHKNLGFFRVDEDTVRPVDSQFQRHAVLSETDFHTLVRVLGKDMLTFTEQEHVRRDELPAVSLLSRQNLAALPNPLHFVIEKTMDALPEAEDDRIDSIRRQLDPMFANFNPDLHPIHKLIEGLLAVNTAIRRYAATDHRCFSEKGFVEKIHEILLPIHGSVPPDRLTPYNRAIESYLRDYRNRNDTALQLSIPSAHRSAFNNIHHLLQLMRDIYGRHKPRELPDIKFDVFQVLVDDEPVLDHRGAHTALATDLSSARSGSLLAPTGSMADDVSSSLSDAYSEVTPDSELMVGRLADSPMAQRAVARGGWKQPLSYFEDVSARRGGNAKSPPPSPWSRGRVRDAVRTRLSRSSSPNREHRRFQPRSPSPHRDRRSPDPTPRIPQGAASFATSRRPPTPTHPHSAHARQRLGAPAASSGAPPPRANLKANGREYLPDKAYKRIRDIRDRMRATIDGNADLNSAMSALKYVKAETDEMLHTFLSVGFDDESAEAETDAMTEHLDDDFIPVEDETVNILQDEHDIGHEFPSLTPTEVRSVRMLSDETAHQLNLIGYDDVSQDQRSDVMNAVIDKMQSQMPMEHFMTLSECVESTRANVEEPIVLLSTQTVYDKTIRMEASHYDSCASQSFEFSRDGLVPNSFQAFDKDNAPRVSTATGSDAADGMGFKRYHHPIDDQMREQASAAGLDLSNYDVFTSLMPPIVCEKFQRPYSIMGGPTAKECGYRYNQGRLDEKDTLTLCTMPDGKDLLCDLHHKPNGLPIAGLIPDILVRSLGLRSICVYTMKPYRDVDAIKHMKQRWILKDPDKLYTEIFETCVSSMTHVLPSPMPPASDAIVASTDLTNMHESPRDAPMQSDAKSQSQQSHSQSPSESSHGDTQVLVGEAATRNSKGSAGATGLTGPQTSFVSPNARKSPSERDTAPKSRSHDQPSCSQPDPETPSFVSLFNKLLTVFTVALVGAGLCSELYFQYSSRGDSTFRLPINVSYIIEPKRDLQDLAMSEAKFQDRTLRCFDDLRECVHNLESGKWDISQFQVQVVTATLPCLRETVMNIHNYGSLQPVAEHEVGDLFVDYLARFCAIVQPDAVLCEMTPEHCSSDGSHPTVAKRFEQLGYQVNVTHRLSSAFCGDHTDRNRWFMICLKLPGPTFDLYTYCNTDYPNAIHILDKPSKVSSELWIDAPCIFRKRGEDTLPWGDDYPRDPRFLGQYVSRAVLQGYVEGRRVKECKIWDVEKGPFPTVTRQSLLIIDPRTTRKSKVRFASLTECARSMSFYPRQIAHLRRIQHDQAMEQIAGAVPCRTLYTVYACLLEQLAIRLQLHGHMPMQNLCTDVEALISSIPKSLFVDVPSGNLENLLDTRFHSPLIEIPDTHDTTGFLPPDVLHDTPADKVVDLLDTRIYSDAAGFLPQEFFRIDFDITTDTLDLSSEAAHADEFEANVLIREHVESMHLGFTVEEQYLYDTEIPESESELLVPDTEDESLRVKRSHNRRRIDLSDVPIHRPPSKEYYAAYKRVNDWHKITHERDPAAIERIIATTTGHGLKRGDSRYLDDCDECSATIDTVQRTHQSSADGTARAPIGLRPGHKYMVDGGDATVRSKWGSFRYFLIFIDAKSSYIIIYYLRDNSAKSFVTALQYVDKLTRIRKGYGVQSFYGDFFSTHLDQNVLGALRADKGWEFEVTPPYCHWLNGYCEVMMRVFKRDARVRLKALLGVQWDGSIIKDASPWWPFAVEHALQYRTISSSATIEHDFGVVATREQMFMEDLTVMPQFNLMPFGSICFVVMQQSKRFNQMTDTAERCIYLMSGRYNPFSHAFADARQAHIVMRPNWRLQVTARCVFPHLKTPPVSRVAPGDSASRLASASTAATSRADDIVAPERADAPSDSQPAPDAPAPPLTPWRNPYATDHPVNPHVAAAEQDTGRRVSFSIPAPSAQGNFDAVPMVQRPSAPPAPALNPAPMAAPRAEPRDVSPPIMPTAAPPPSPMAPVPAPTPAPAPAPQAASPPRAAPVVPRPSPTRPPPPEPPPAPPPLTTRSGRVRTAPVRFVAGDATADNKERKALMVSTVLGGDAYRSALRDSLSHDALHVTLATAAMNSTAHTVFSSAAPDVPASTNVQTSTAADRTPHAVATVPVDNHGAPISKSHDYSHCAWFTETSRSGRQWNTSLQDPSARFHQQGRPDMQEREFLFSAVDIHDDDRNVIREHLASALGYELGITQEEWTYVKLFLTDMSKKERKKTKAESDIGESRSAGTFGMNADVDDSIMDMLLTQYLFNPDRDNGEVALLVENPFTLEIEKHKLLDLKDVPEEQHPQMLAAMAKEFNDLNNIGCFAGIEMPANRRAISSRIVLKVKFRANGDFEKFKARCVAKGFLQRLGYDFFSTFSPMATLTTVRAIIAIAVHKGLPIKHADVPQAFIKSTLDTDVWMQLPPGISFIDKDKKVWKIVKLIRSLYGLRQAPALFHKELVRFMSQPALRFKQLIADQCVYYHVNSDSKKWVIVASEVDDLVITGDDDVLIARFRSILESEYKVTDYEDINSFLGINIDYNMREHYLTMDVTNKIEGVFKAHAILKPICDMKGDVPINEYAMNRPDSDEAKYTPMDKYIAERYASINGSIIYLAITCRPDITFAVGKTSRGMHAPKPHHVCSLKMVLAYLWQTRHFKLYFRQNGGKVRELYQHIRQQDQSIAIVPASDGQNIDVMGGFADANFAHLTDPQRRSISGFCCFIFMCIVSWRSKLQTVTAGSTHEAELVAVALCSNEMVWIRKLLIEIGFAVGLTSVIREQVDKHDPSSVDKHCPELEPDFVMERNMELEELVDKYKMDPPYLFNDNKGTVQTVNNPETKLTNKHIDTRYFATRKFVAEQKLRVAYVPTHLNLSDMFTKALIYRAFAAFREYTGVMP